MTRLTLLAILLVVLSLCPAAGGEPIAERLLLKNGDRLTGSKEGEADGLLQWKTPFGDVLKIPLDQVEKIELPADVQPATIPTPPPEPAVPPPEVKPPPPTPTPEQLAQAQAELRQAAEMADELEHPWSFQTLSRRAWRGATGRLYTWTKRVTLGTRYLTGNSDETMVNLQADFERQYPLVNFQMQAGGQFGKSNGVRGTNRWYANSTNDFKLGEKWIYFLKHTDEYDEFQNLDYRGTLSGGLGYRFWNEDRKRLIVRLGPAGTYEDFREPHDTRTTFDLFGELEARWPLAKRIQFEEKMTVYPSVDEFDRFRANVTANVIISLDERDCWNLQFGIQDQYLSHPSPGRVPHDLWTNLSIMYQKK